METYDLPALRNAIAYAETGTRPVTRTERCNASHFA